MGKVGDGRVCLFACFFCSRCTTAPAPALCVVTLPPPHFPPPPLLPPATGVLSRGTGITELWVKSRGSHLRGEVLAKLLVVPAPRLLRPASVHDASVHAESEGGCGLWGGWAAPPRAKTAPLLGRDIRAPSGLGRCLLEQGGFSRSPRTAVHDVYFHVPWKRALGERR